MAGEVKQMILAYINDYSDIEVPIDEIIEEFGTKLTRIDVLAALRELENDKIGVLAVGRRGKQTRFIKGATRVRAQINESAMTNLRETVDGLKNGEILSLETAEELFDNKNQTLDALKILQEEGVGRFYIGRRGGESRFVKGVNSGANNNGGILKSKMFVVGQQSSGGSTQMPPQVTNKSEQFVVYNNILIKTHNIKHTAFNSLKDAIGSLDGLIDNIDVSVIEDKVKTNGFCDIESLLAKLEQNDSDDDDCGDDGCCDDCDSAQ